MGEVKGPSIETRRQRPSTATEPAEGPQAEPNESDGPGVEADPADGPAVETDVPSPGEE